HFAEVAILLAAADAFVEQIENKIVDAEGGGDVISGLGEFGGDFRGQAGDVQRPMLAGAKEKGADDDPCRAALHTVAVGGGDGRFGQFHVGGFDDVVFFVKALGKKARELFE